MKLAWATDIHLNFLNDHERRRFLESPITASGRGGPGAAQRLRT